MLHLQTFWCQPNLQLKDFPPNNHIQIYSWSFGIKWIIFWVVWPIFLELPFFPRKSFGSRQISSWSFGSFGSIHQFDLLAGPAPPLPICRTFPAFTWRGAWDEGDSAGKRPTPWSTVRSKPFPEESNVNIYICMYVGFSENRIQPKSEGWSNLMILLEL